MTTGIIIMAIIDVLLCVLSIYLIYKNGNLKKIMFMKEQHEKLMNIGCVRRIRRRIIRIDGFDTNSLNDLLKCYQDDGWEFEKILDGMAIFAKLVEVESPAESEEIRSIREKISALQDETMDKNGNFGTSYDEGRFDALTAMDNYLDTLKEKVLQK